MPTSQILYFKKRQHGLLQSDGNKTALQQSLSLSAEMKRNTYQGLEKERHLDRKTAGESSSGEGGQYFDKTCGQVGLSMTQGDSL